MEGEVDSARWPEALWVSDRFHDVVSGVTWSPAIRGRHHWAIGDAFAWGEADIAFPDRFRPLIDGLRESRHSIDDLTSQLVHGDLGGNIVFHPELPPAVIDVSPYWRPKRYADAIIVVDAIAWAGADLQTIEHLRDPIGRQMLYRAILSGSVPRRLPSPVTTIGSALRLLPISRSFRRSAPGSRTTGSAPHPGGQPFESAASTLAAGDRPTASRRAGPCSGE